MKRYLALSLSLLATPLLAQVPASIYGTPIVVYGVDPVGAATTAQANALAAIPYYQNPIAVPTGGAEYPMLNGSGTTVSDISGNGNNATFATGTNSPTWYTYGVSLNDAGTAITPYQAISTPLATWGTFYIAHCTPTMITTTGTSIGGVPATTYPTLVGSLSATAGVIVIGVGSGQNTFNTVQPTIFQLNGNHFTTSLADSYGGCHVYGFSAGSTQDHITIDGREPTSYTTQGASGANIAISGGGTYQIGVGGANPATNGLRGVVTYAVFYPAAHTTAQMALESAYIQYQLSLRTSMPKYPNAQNSRTAQAIFVGDSLTAGYEGSAAWTASFAPTNTYVTTNYGIGGSSAIDMCKMGEQRWINSIVPGMSTVFLWGGTNDVSFSSSAANAWASLIPCAAKAHAYGARAVISTMIDRTNYTTQHDAVNALIRSNYKAAGFDYLNDVAMVPGLGSDGANTGTACFNADKVHLTGPGTGTCATIGSTALSGYGVVAALASAAINTLDGSSQIAPTLTASNAFTSTYANNYVIQTPTAAATYSLVDCLGQSTPRTIVNGSSSYAITVSAVNSETVSGSTTVSAGATAVFIPVLSSPTAGGCTWQKTQ